MKSYLKAAREITRGVFADNFQTGNQGLLRQKNLSGIMHHLHDKAPISRADLAKMTGLNKTTVSSLITELMDNHFVQEIGISSPKGIGRRSVMLDINPARGAIVSAELGGDFLSAVTTDFATEIIWKKRESISPTLSQTAILERLLKLLKEAIAIGNKKGYPLLGLALGVPGLVDGQSGNLLFAPNLGWKDVPLRDWLRKSFDTRIIVENEATLAALGEQYFGAAEGYSEVLYVSAGVGLGGGMVIEGHLYNGASGFAGEFGHMTMNPEGESCMCGNRGCWETQVSQFALFRYIKEAIKAGSTSSLPAQTKGKLDHLTVEMVVDAARRGDRAALVALDKVGKYLGTGIASLINVLNPSLVVFGGILSLAGEFLLPRINEELHKRALHWTEEKVKLVVAKYGFDATVMGGVARVYRAVLANPPILERAL
ncbi:MAG: ROK family transcriptional regulator [Acidobacteriota bacterium]